jgi:hypothetical protein
MKSLARLIRLEYPCLWGLSGSNAILALGFFCFCDFSISGAILALGLLYLWWGPYRWRGHTFGKALSFAKGKVFKGYQGVLIARLSVYWH